MKRLSLVLPAALFAAVFVATAGAGLPGGAPQTPATVASYTGCLSPILSVVYDVAAGDLPAHPPCRPPASVIHLSSGDLTSLTAGTGLTGGGDNGDVSVGIAPSYRLPQGCAAGKTAAWDGSGWACVSSASQADFNSLVALLSSPGTVNDSGNPVHWTKLKGVPAGFADGTDDVGPSYSAGFGLNLSGTAFSVDPASIQSRVTGSCAPGSSIAAIAQDGTVTCHGHATYTASDGVTLSGSDFRIADGGVTTAKLADVAVTNEKLGDGSVDTAKLAPGSVTLSKLSFDPTTQPEFDALATLLSSAGTINTGGNPVDWTKLKNVPAGFTDGVDNAGGNGGLNAYCALAQANPRSFPNPPCRAHKGTLDTVGAQTSLAIGTDGNPVISYRGPGGAQKVAHCSDPVCMGKELSTLDSLGGLTSIAIGTDGNPVVSYLGPGNELKIARCSDPACVAKALITIDTVGFYTSLAIGTDGNPVISYTGPGNAVKVAHCYNAACSSAELNTLDSSGFDSSLAIGTDGNPVVSYYTLSNEVKIARCTDSACVGKTLNTLDSNGILASLAIGTDGNPVVSYKGIGGLRIAHCGDPACAATTLNTVVDGGTHINDSSITIGIDGNPVVSYKGFSGLKIAHCGDPACAASTLSSPDGTGMEAQSSIAIGTDGNPVVSYRGPGNELKVARPAIPG